MELKKFVKENISWNESL